MIIVGIGIDLLKNKRIIYLYKKYKYRFIKKILNKNEINLFNKNKNKIRFLCKSFTIKEAIIKALGTGFRMNINFNDINIYKNELGKPIVEFNFKHILINKNLKTKISISHEVNTTIAIAIIIIK